MNYMQSFRVKIGKMRVKKQGNSLIISNHSRKKRGYVIFTKPFYSNGTDIKIDVDYTIKKGEKPQVKLFNRKLRVVERIEDSSTTYYEKINKLFFVSVSLEPNSVIELKTLDVCEEKKDEAFTKANKGKILLITPGYPSESNKYSYAFVHTRVLEYLKQGWDVDVRVVNDNFIDKTCFYEFEGVHVIRTGFNEIRLLLQTKKYEKIFMHFFSEQYVQILDACNVTDTDIFVFIHGSDVIYRDINILTNSYFKPIKKATKKQESFFETKDKMLKRYNEMPNVKFIFPSKWSKDRTEKENNIVFNNCDIIPTFIDEYLFNFTQKTEDMRKKITIIRKYDNYSTYGIDMAVKAIEELSKKDFFKELEFNIYGDGEYHNKLLKPLKKFDNVKIHKRFLSHEEIAKVHKENGIALFATRYETLGVSAAEAAMSGLVVVSNEVAAVPEMFDKKLLARKENYKDLAKIIERLYKNPKEYVALSKKVHDKVKKNYGYEATMKKEIEILQKQLPRKKYKPEKISDEKVLTISIAAYNVEKYLYNSVMSLLNSNVADKLEILIVNDGSKDNTAKIGKQLEKMTTLNGKSIVKFIDKENGGHGSTINKGIELATGKYFKLMDGDDYFDTESLNKLVKYLEESDEDFILNNYVEDLAVYGRMNPIQHYNFMEVGKVYKIEDLANSKNGFKKWGPLLSTTTFKTQLLKDANFKISEHCFYVDMELNSIAFSKAETVKFYPLDLYIYYLGRQGQSVSAASFKRNYKNHEHVTLRIIEDIYYKEELSPIKKEYLKKKIIYPLITAQYYITTEHFDEGKEFMEFDSQLKKYPEFYNAKEVIDSRVKIYRKTRGKFMKTVKSLVKIKHIVFRNK